MIPVGYMYKEVVARPEWVRNDAVADICSVSGCASKTIAEKIDSLRGHNRYHFFDTIKGLNEQCRLEGIAPSGYILFYYDLFENEYDDEEKAWAKCEALGSPVAEVQKPQRAVFLGYDVVASQCSPLSCNSLADEIAVNRHCLFDTFDHAVEALESGKFDDSEPGPFRIFAVYRVQT